MIRNIRSNLATDIEGPDLTPLIDVVFTLIVFLILTMGTSQVMTEIQLSKSEKSLVESEAENRSILVEVSRRKGFWKFDNRLFNDFEAFADAFLKQYGQQSDRRVVLALEHDLPVEKLIDLMDFLALNEFTNIRIASEWSPK